MDLSRLREMNPVETGEDRYWAESTYTYDHDPRYLADQQWLASLIGSLTLAFPALLLAASLLFSETCFHHSISHFYYSTFWGDVLLGAFFGLGVLFLVYRGENAKEGMLAGLAGIMLFGLALFPPENTGCTEAAFSARMFGDFTLSGEALSITELQPLERQFMMAPASQALHLVFGGMLFLVLAFYSWQVLTRPVSDKVGSPHKAMRNRIYRTCAVLTILAVGFLAISIWWDKADWDKRQLTFWGEYFALATFGISWLVKGRLWGRYLMDDRDTKGWKMRRSAS